MGDLSVVIKLAGGLRKVRITAWVGMQRRETLLRGSCEEQIKLGPLSEKFKSSGKLGYQLSQLTKSLS